jgi:arylsulfatase A-like enzyme
MVLIVGPDVAAGQAMPKGSLADVAPTVLALLGLPLSREMDGAVLSGAFRPGVTERLAITYVETYGKPAHAGTVGEGIDQQKLDTLRALGYVE